MEFLLYLIAAAIMLTGAFIVNAINKNTTALYDIKEQLEK